jgi:CheY-like chemotaxis protein
VLVVDDNDSARTVLVEMVRKMGLRAAEARDGAEAAEAVAHADSSHQPFDLMLLDWKMPVLDGVDCIKRLTRTPLRHAIPTVLMTTAFSRDEIARRLAAERLSVAATLCKPVTPSMLLDACLQAVGHPPSQAPRAHRRSDGQPADRKALAGARILLVEDNEINQELARDLLEGAGIVVTVAGTGRQALERLSRERFDAVLMDCQMPEMDGYAATRALRRQPRWHDLPVIAMTANALVGDREKALEAGMNDHIAKPINVEDMFSTLARHVRPAEAQDAAPCGIDRDRALAELDGNERLYKRLVRMFREREAHFVPRFRLAREAGSLEEAVRLAHDLKSVSATLGAYALAQAAEGLESAAQAGAEAAVLEPLLLALGRQLDAVIDELAAWDEPSTMLPGGLGT